jgi:hypothetical protein
VACRLSPSGTEVESRISCFCRVDGDDTFSSGASPVMDRLSPHSLQNLLPGGFMLSQLGQDIFNLLPHSLQNLASAGLSN